MKRLISTLAILIFILSVFTACAKNADSNILKIGMDDAYPPMEFKDSNGKDTIGFDVDVGNEIAKRLNKKAEFISTAWVGIFQALDTNNFDIIMSAVSINPKRQEAYALTDPYISNNLVIITRNDDKAIKDPKSLKDKKVGTQAGTTSDEYLTELAKEVKFEHRKYDLVTQPFSDLKTGRIDALVADVVVGKYYMKKDKASFKVAWESSEKEPMGIVCRKSDTELRDKINKIIKDMNSDGTMKKISEKWFGEDVTKNLK